MTGFTHCLVHAGTHKTGTTSLQHALAMQRSELAAAGFAYPAMGQKKRDHNALAHRLAVCADDELPLLRRELAALPPGLASPQGGGAVLLLSAEELSTRICRPDPWAGFDDGAYWEHRRHYLARLRSVLPAAARIEVFLCFRDHESYAHALYATKVQSGRLKCGFAEFIRRCAPIFDYRRQVEVLADALGPVRVLGFNELRTDLVRRSFDWLGLPIGVADPPRLRPTPALDLIHWLAAAVQSGAGRRERERRAAFCRDYEPGAAAADAPVRSLWSSQQQRQDFLRRCVPPPLDAWPQPPAAVDITGSAELTRRAQQIEAEYRQWLHDRGHRNRWVFFLRRW